VIEEPAATSLVLPGQVVTRDDSGNLIIEERPGGGGRSAGEGGDQAGR
jgi:hypothetical protein